MVCEHNDCVKYAERLLCLGFQSPEFIKKMKVLSLNFGILWLDTFSRGNRGGYAE